jgi:hypothetical protein
MLRISTALLALAAMCIFAVPASATHESFSYDPPPESGTVRFCVPASSEATPAGISVSIPERCYNVPYTHDPLPRQVPIPHPGPPPPPPPPPPPQIDPCVSASWPVGSRLPARIVESAGTVRPVSTSAEFRSALTVANPGDIIDIQDGLTIPAEANFLVSRSGTAAAPITIQGGPGVVSHTMFRIEANFVRLRNLVIDGTGNEQNAWGIYGRSGTDNEVCGVTTRDVHTLTSGPNPQGVITGSGTARWLFLNHVSENNGRPGGSVLDHGFYHSGTGHWIVNGLARNNAGFGAQLYASCQNCTVVHFTSTGNRLKGGLISAGSSNGNRAFNSVAYNNGTYGFERTAGTLAGDHLLAFGNPSGNYRDLAPCIACITGTLADAIGHSNPDYSPPFDLNGNLRDSAPDAGAYENP